MQENIQISMVMDNQKMDLEYSRDDSFVPLNVGGAPQDVFDQFLSSAKSSYTLKVVFTQENYREEGHFITSGSGVMRNITANNENNYFVTLPFTQYINFSIVWKSGRKIVTIKTCRRWNM